MCGTTHGWTASRQLATILTDADDNLTRQAVDPGIALGPVYIRRVVAATASGTWMLGILLPARSNFFMVASLQEQQGSKLAAHQHHGQVPAAS